MAGWLGGWVAGWLAGQVGGRLEPPPPPPPPPTPSPPLTGTRPKVQDIALLMPIQTKADGSPLLCIAHDVVPAKSFKNPVQPQTVVTSEKT